MGRPPAGGVTAPATSRSVPRACGEESRRHPEPRALDAEDASRRRRAAPSAAAIFSPCPSPSHLSCRAGSTPASSRGLCKSDARPPACRYSSRPRPSASPPVSAREIAEPLHESVRIALNQRFPPKTSHVAASVTTTTIAFSPLTRTAVSSAPVTLTRPRPPPDCLRRAFRPASWDVAPYAHARYGDAGGGSGRLAERGDSPSAHASAAHPRILWVCPPRATPSGQCLKALSQSELRCRTTVTLSS